VAARKKTAVKAAPAKKKAAQRKQTPKATKASQAKKASRKAAKPQQKASAKKDRPSRVSAKKPARKSSVAKTISAAAQLGLLGEVEALARLMEEHGLIDVSYAVEADGAKEIHVSRGGVPGIVHGAVPAVPAMAAPSAQAPAAGTGGDSADSVDTSLHAFVSPMVGTFYRAPSPEASPFASVSDRVDTGSPVCIIEAMKVMNEITPDLAGDVVSIEVENGEAVEFGQTLMLIRPR
jgi:acetyl-CoA carboxylase biotin carboxyl carrier protein